jgi:glycosyltransferase involved in cell wall biosynthesis
MGFLHSFNPGGVERVALRLCRAWGSDPAIDVRLVVGRDEGAMRDEAPPTAVMHGLAPPRGLAKRLPSLRLLWLLLREIRRQRPDVLFVAGNTYAVFAALARLLLGRRCPVTVLKISNDLVRLDMAPPLRGAYRLWLWLQGRLINRFTGLAAPMQSEIVAAMHVPAARVTVIEDPALDAAGLAALTRLGAARRPSATGPRHYIAVGRLVPQKNFALAIEAFALAAEPDDRLTIIGDGPERPRLAARIAALGLSARVAMPGHGAVAPALAAADIFVLSSDYEALPAVVVEALASGLPVVATDCCVSMRAMVGDFGTLVPRRDARGLATAMRAQSPLDAEARTAAAAAMAVFSVERAAGAYRRLFQEADLEARPQNAILVA